MLLLGMACSNIVAETLFVSPTGNDSQDGSSWTLAKQTVQAGLSAATSGDQVWVAKGIYTENITLTVGVGLYGGFSGSEDPSTYDPADRDFETNETVIDGNQSGSVVLSPASATSDTLIDGFTLRNGDATRGGGLYVQGSPTIANNTITQNKARHESSNVYGGGIYCYQSNVTIINNTISVNETDAVLGFSEYGGGIYCEESSPQIEGNFVSHNVATKGGGIYLVDCESPVVLNNTMKANRGALGGGLVLDDTISPLVANNWIVANIATDQGGGIVVSHSDPTIVNNTIVRNYAHIAGGVELLPFSTTDLTNNIIAFNTSGVGNPVGNTVATFKNNCVYGNEEYDFLNLSDPTGIDGNLSQDPLLVDLAYGDFHIQPASPCRDTGLDSATLPTWSDVDGQPRLMGAHVDIGADESDGTAWSQGPGRIVRVKPDGDDSHDGSTWELAKQTIQGAIAALRKDGGDVWVKAGTYPERISIDPFAHLFGGFAGNESERLSRDWDANATIIDGEGEGNVVLIRNGIRCITIDGFTIQNGVSTSGGGFYVFDASPTIANNIIRHCTVENYGAGIRLVDADAVVVNNTIVGNQALGGAQGGGRGGGISISISNPVIAHNVIKDNHTSDATIFDSRGGGLFVRSSGGVIHSNVISANFTERYGGGVYFNNSTTLFVNNHVTANESKEEGGGVMCLNASPTLANSVIVGNQAVTAGGGLYSVNSVVTIRNTSITANVAATGLAIACDSENQQDPSVINVANSIIWDASDWFWNNDSTTLAVAFSNTPSPVAGIGNLNTDPLFMRTPSPGLDGEWRTEDDDFGDLRLMPGSPCIDAARNTDVPADLADLDNDGELSERTPIDLAGGPRFINDPSKTDTGGGLSPTVDMGPYEAPPTPFPDYDLDGDVDTHDNQIFLSCMTGPEIIYDPFNLPSGCAATPNTEGVIVADFDADHDVDMDDYGVQQRCTTGELVPVDLNCLISP